MTGFDYDVLIIGSGFGGSVAALRLGHAHLREGHECRPRRRLPRRRQSPG